MGLNLSINGTAKIFKIYNLSRMEIEGIDFSAYDIEVKEDVIELMEILNEFIETGEADAYDYHQEIHGVEPENCKFKLTNSTTKEIVLDEITLKNIKPQELIKDIENANVGDLFFIKNFEGEALWDFDSDIEVENIDPQKLEIGYIECLEGLDQYDIFREGIYDLLCDTVSTDYIRYEGEKFELLDFVFHPIHIFAQLYIVKEDPLGETKVLQKVQYGGIRLAGTDLDVSDLENN
ncbi:hypothetical protein [Nitrosophilus kaiyonis]|uniref:hypothetical protein n=1 Tax=Nitrosophilus kaiyonis TaxID=2930200 RepID=UPI002491EC7E|nr:hypothetical protein [Nitrosophilus kaiyonis]